MSYVNKPSRDAVWVTADPDKSGNFICDGTADDVQIQAAWDEILKEHRGEVVLGEGTFTLADELFFQGEGSSTAHKHRYFRGQGVNNTTLDGVASKNIVRLQNAMSVSIRDMTLNGDSTGLSLIYGEDGGGGSEISLYHGGFKNLRLVNNAPDTWCLHLQNPARWYTEGTMQMRVAANSVTQGGGLQVQNTNLTTSWNDSTWNAYTQIRLYGNNSTGVKALGNASRSTSVMTVPALFLVVDMGYTGTICFDGDYVNNWKFFALQCEYCDEGIQLNYGKGCYFSSPFFNVNDEGTAIYCDSNSERNIFENFKKTGLDGDVAGATLIDDNQATERSGNLYRNIFHSQSTNPGAVSVSTTQAVRIYDTVIETADGVFEYSNNRGTETIVNGTLFTDVAHGLFETPPAESIRVTFIEDPSDFGHWWISNRGVVTFRVNVEVDPGQDVDFVWSADVNHW